MASSASSKPTLKGAWTLIDGTDHHPEWVVFDRHGHPLEQSSFGASWTEPPTTDRVVVLFSARHATPLHLDLPPMSAQRQAEALQWAAEEFLAGPVEHEHVVAGQRDDEGRLMAMSISHETMNEWVDQIRPFQPDALIPDALCLPWAPGVVSLAQHGERLLMRWGLGSYGAFDFHTGWQLLDTLPSQAWHWYGDQAPPVEYADRVVWAHPEQSLLACLAPQAHQGPINALTGIYASESARAMRGHWRWVAGLAMAAVVMAFMTVGVEYRLLAERSGELQGAVSEDYQALFPGRNGMGRERELTARAMAQLTYGDAAGLLTLMARVGPVLVSTPALAVQALEYEQGQLSVALLAPDVAALDEVGQQLRALELEAAVESATLSDQGASGRLVIRMGDS